MMPNPSRPAVIEWIDAGGSNRAIAEEYDLQIRAARIAEHCARILIGEARQVGTIVAKAAHTLNRKWITSPS